MIRTIALVVAGIAALSSLAAPAAMAAPVASDEPVCLITTSFNKSTVCAELMSTGAGYGTFRTGSDATLTVTVEYQPVGAVAGTSIVLASKTVSGTGLVEATTDAVVVPNVGSVQACSTATLPYPRQPQHDFHLCTAARR